MRSAGLLTAIVVAAGLVLTGCGGAKSDNAQVGGQTGAVPNPNGSRGVASAAAAAPTAASGAGTITFHVKVSFTGAYTITDGYDVVFDPIDYAGDQGDPASAPKSCADVARLGTSAGNSDNPPSFEAPTPDTTGGTMASGQNSLGFQAVIDAYSGPKTYTGSEIDSAGGLEISNTPMVPDDGGGDLNFGDAANQSSLTVNPDGSGTLKIVGWEDAGSRTLSGTVTWTCAA